MKRITYITNVRLPTEKAHGLQIMKMCEAWNAAGINAELVVPDRYNKILEDPFSYYPIRKKFKITKLWCVDFVRFDKWLGAVAFWLQSLSFYFSVKKHLKKNVPELIYIRDWPLAIFLPKNSTIVYEAHTFPKRLSFLFRGALQKVSKLIVISHGLKEEFLRQGFPEDKILVAPDGFDPELFKVSSTQSECRIKLSLPPDKKIVLYSGHLYHWKGADIVLDAAGQFEPEILFVFVGGTERNTEQFKMLAKQTGHTNILVLGHRPHHLIPLYLCAADVLVLPNLADEKISSHYTSPLKLFEYLSAGRPIVASNLPSIREILSENNAVLCPPGDPGSLASAIRLVLNNKELSDKITKEALANSGQYTWSERAMRIFDFIG